MVRNIRLPRRSVLRALAATTVLAASFALPLGRAQAQENVDPSFSNVKLPTLGLSELNLTQTDQGLEGVPASVPAGLHLVNYTAEGVTGYLLFAQQPEGLTEEEAITQARDAGSNDIQGEGWVYGGGTYAGAGTTVQVVVDLTPGEWSVVNSHMVPEGSWETDEIYGIVPLSVTEADAATASPVPGVTADVHVDMPGMAFVMDTDTVAAGPRLWEFASSGDQAHHVVIMRTPYLIGGEEIDQMVSSFMSATPPAGDAWFTQSVWVGYTALISPGYRAINEFDFEPGSYVLLCFIADTETGMPHLMMGMWAPFTVE